VNLIFENHVVKYLNYKIFCHESFAATCLSVEMLKKYMVRER